MIGAMIGDIVGSRYEFNNHKSKDFKLFHKDCDITDDSIMTLAIMDAILNCHGDYSNLSEETVKSMMYFGKKYPDPMGAYGRLFNKWLKSKDHKPYYSYGNGAAMRVSPCGLISRSFKEAKELSKKVTQVTHNHPEGLKGAEAVAICIYLAQPHNMCTKEDIDKYVSRCYYYLDFTLDYIRPTYKFYSSCQNSVPVAIKAFLESTDFEDAIRNAVSVGGDSDTIAAITGSIAGAYYGIPDDIFVKAMTYFDEEDRDIIIRFQNLYIRNNSQK